MRSYCLEYSLTAELCDSLMRKKDKTSTDFITRQIVLYFRYIV